MYYSSLYIVFQIVYVMALANFPQRFLNAGFMDEEAVVNAVWNYILGAYYPTPNSVIAPEYRTVFGGRGDLTVVYADPNDGTARHVLFNYEGKRAGLTPAQWDDGILQLRGYLDAADNVRAGKSNHLNTHLVC